MVMVLVVVVESESKVRTGSKRLTSRLDSTKVADPLTHDLVTSDRMTNGLMSSDSMTRDLVGLMTHNPVTRD